MHGPRNLQQQRVLLRATAQSLAASGLWAPGATITVLDKCAACGGLGMVGKAACAACVGDGWVQVAVEIPDAPVDPRYERLTRREEEVLTLVASGYTNPQVARQLVISERTVEHHRMNITIKLGMRGRSDLWRYAHTHGLIGPSDEEEPEYAG